ADGLGARRLARQAADLYLQAQLPEGAARAEAMQAAALLQQGDAAGAREGYAATLAQAQALQALSLQMRCQAGVGLAALAEGDLPAADEALQAAVAQFESQWQLLPGDELRGAFIAQHLAPYQGLLALALQAHQRQPDAQTAAQVLQRLDALRARALVERLRQGQASSNDEAAEAQRASLQWLHRRLQRQADEGEVSASLVETLHETERHLLEHTRRQRLATPVAAAPALTGLDLSALQAALGEHDAVLVQGRLGDELLACVVRRGGVQVVRGIASFDAVLAAWRLARFQLDALRHGAAPVQAHLATLSRRAQQRLQQLHALVWAPLSGLLEDAQRVLVVPAEGLAGLPFAALHDGLCYLAQRHQLAEAPSAQVALRGLQRAPVPARCLLALGESSRLAHAGDEAQAVAALFN
ncbi:MAG: hypothetical protein CFE45_28815, partial [Burkholderiales bacterium PBB5]